MRTSWKCFECKSVHDIEEPESTAHARPGFMLQRRCPKCGGSVFRVRLEDQIHAFNLKLAVLALVVGAGALIVYAVRSLLPK